MKTRTRSTLGAIPDETGVRFRVWAPLADRIAVVFESGRPSRALESTGDGYFEQHVPDVAVGELYRFQVDGEHLFPDPASRFQPRGVHGPSAVVDPSRYTWEDGSWEGIERRDLIFYELHVGTFTRAGTFDGVRERLSYLEDLGVTAIELMPVADFPGRWNWGYDQAALYAPSRAYGEPDDLRRLVDAAHQTGLAVYLDVIYNHLGPDGAYAAAYAPFFTDKYETPWGDAINFDDDHSGGVRQFFIGNAVHWLQEYHIDGLRLDATFAIEDHSDTHFLADLSEAVEMISSGPERILVAEDHRNENILVRPRHQGGYGLDAVWADDFHHQVRNMTAGDEQGYFGNYKDSTMTELSQTLERGWYYDGRPTLISGKPKGSDPAPVELDQCVFCIQNHDQIGNRPTGNRLTDDIPLPVYRAVSALLLFLPELPLLFMGQEWAASTPFQYFTDHNEELGKLVSEGRSKEFEHIADFQGTIPDPQASETFRASRLDWDEPTEPAHRQMLEMYRDLLTLRPQFAGRVQAQVHSKSALTVVRNNHHLLVTVEGDAVIPVPDDGELTWHSDRPAYTQTSNPPHEHGGTIHFARPGAALFHSPTDRS